MNEYQMMSDEEIIGGGISADDSGKITELVSRYTDHVLLIAKRYEGSADFHELVSEGFEALLRAISSYDSDSGYLLKTYVNTCVVNSMKNVVSKAGRSKENFTAIADEEFNLIPDPAPPLDELMVLREQTDDVSYHIGHSLTELERYCINGVVLGLSYEEMAKKLGVDKKSVDNAISRARAKLRRLCGGSAGDNV